MGDHKYDVISYYDKSYHMIQSFPHRWRPGSDWAEFDRVLCPLVDEDTEHEQVQVSRHHHHRYQHQNYHQNHYVVGSVNLCSISSDLQAKGIHTYSTIVCCFYVVR